MKKKRRRFTAQFKAKVALEALKEQKTLTELAAEYEVHPNQIAQWKRQLLDESSEIFSPASANEKKKQQSLEDELYKQIGRLKVELEWLKKKLPT